MDSDRIKGAAKEVGGKIEEIAGNAIFQEEIRSDGVGLQIEGMGQNLYGQAKDNLRDVGDRAGKVLRDTNDVAGKVFEEGVNHAKKASEAGERAIEFHPLKSIILALTVGFVAGVLVRRI